MLPVASVCELSKQIIQFLDLSILFEYLVIFSLSKSWHRVIHSLLHILEIIRVHCFGRLYRWHCSVEIFSATTQIENCKSYNSQSNFKADFVELAEYFTSETCTSWIFMKVKALYLNISGENVLEQIGENEVPVFRGKWAATVFCGVTKIHFPNEEG